MSESPYYETRFRFEFDLADRLRKALRVSGMGVSEIADKLEVGRNTVSTWINGKITPDRFTIKRFAELTDAPYEWLLNGTTPSPDGGGVDAEPPVGLEPTAFALQGASVLEFPCLSVA